MFNKKIAADNIDEAYDSTLGSGDNSHIWMQETTWGTSHA
jgi:hypothetical protein